MPYAQNQGVRIHYQTEGAGPPLVLQHGFTDSLESWYELGYVEALQNAIGSFWWMHADTVPVTSPMIRPPMHTSTTSKTS